MLSTPLQLLSLFNIIRPVPGFEEKKDNAKRFG